MHLGTISLACGKNLFKEGRVMNKGEMGLKG